MVKQKPNILKHLRSSGTPGVYQCLSCVAPPQGPTVAQSLEEKKHPF